jgi:outer membrane protein assembly factor BamD (BamD/ComL family)
MGLIFAHYNNPKKDYKKSISYFERILRDYPHSPLTEQAKIWIAVLNMVEQSKRVDIQIEEMKKELLQN